MKVTYDKKAYIDGITGTDVLSLADAKLFLRVDSDAEDALITSLIDVAVAHVGMFIGQSLNAVDDLEFYLPSWGKARFPIGPVKTIKSVKYYDSGNVQRTLNASEYWIGDGYETTQTIRFDEPLADLYDDRRDRVVITADIGYADGSIPPPVIHAVRLLVSQYYDVRENFAIGTIISSEMRNGIKSLLSPYRNIYFA
jgi:uncharacterized phiE125 gp8 family phage protein